MCKIMAHSVPSPYWPYFGKAPASVQAAPSRGHAMQPQSLEKSCAQRSEGRGNPGIHNDNLKRRKTSPPPTRQGMPKCPKLATSPGQPWALGCVRNSRGFRCLCLCRIGPRQPNRSDDSYLCLCLCLSPTQVNSMKRLPFGTAPLEYPPQQLGGAAAQRSEASNSCCFLHFMAQGCLPLRKTCMKVEAGHAAPQDDGAMNDSVVPWRPSTARKVYSWRTRGFGREPQASDSEPGNKTITNYSTPFGGGGGGVEAS